MKHSPSLVAKKPSLQTGRPRCQGEAPLSSAVLHKHDQGKSRANVSYRVYRSEAKEACVGCALPGHRKPTQSTRNQCKNNHSHPAPSSASRNNTGMTNPQSKDNSSEYFKLSLNAFMLLLAGKWSHYKFNPLGFFWWDWFQVRSLCSPAHPDANARERMNIQYRARLT